jgi:hypothetical protein
VSSRTAYDDTGADVPWRVKAGDPIVKVWTVTVAGVAANLTGATLTGAIRTREDSSLDAVGSFTMTLPASGQVRAAYAAGISEPGTYWWAIRVALPSGEVWRGQGPLYVESAGV